MSKICDINLYGKNHNGKVIETDHAMVELEVNLRFKVQKPHRTEAYKFKRIAGQDYFKQRGCLHPDNKVE